MKEAGLSQPLLIPISLVYLSGLFFDLGEGAFDFYVLLTAGKDLAAGAVSYTHLDVYKRQEMTSVARSATE